MSAMQFISDGKVLAEIQESGPATKLGPEHDQTIPVPVGALIKNSNFCFVLAESPVPVLEFQANGDIYIHGRLAGNDLEVVEAMREFSCKVKG